MIKLSISWCVGAIYIRQVHPYWREVMLPSSRPVGVEEIRSTLHSRSRRAMHCRDNLLQLRRCRGDWFMTSPGKSILRSMASEDVIPDEEAFMDRKRASCCTPRTCHG